MKALVSDLRLALAVIMMAELMMIYVVTKWG